jgi:hemoglobin-like flavoprotein
MDIHESLHAILASERGSVGAKFYERFLSECPEAEPLFREVDLQMQAHMLTNSLQIVVAMATHRYPAAMAYLQVLGHRHQVRQIPPELLPRFAKSMVETLRDYHGAAWSSELETEWRHAFEIAVQRMRTGYVSGGLTY